MRRLKVACLVALGGVLGMIGATQASAGHESEVTSYTGCLKSGKIENVAAGDSPAGRCVPPSVEIHFSGGDITAVLTGTASGLQGGSTNGTADLTIAPGFRLPQGCAAGDVAEYDSTSGAWACATDDGATYTAGTGLDLVGNEFSIEPGSRLPACEVTESPEFVRLGTAAPFWSCNPKADANQSCPTGQFANAIGATGSLVCAAASSGSGGALQVFQNMGSGAGIPDDSTSHVYASVSVPAGTYLVLGQGEMGSVGNFDQFSSASCRIPGSVDRAFLGDEDGTTLEYLRLSGVVASPGGSLDLTCFANDGADGADIESPTILAIKIG